MTALLPSPHFNYDLEQFSKIIAEHAHEHPGDLKILEAGCGRQWPIQLPDVPVHVTGIDINADALRKRMDEQGDLDEVIVGDLRTVDVPPEAFSIVYCSFLLEHVEGAEQVLDRLIGALAPGGLLLLRIPDRDSVWGFLARATPHRLHVVYKRRIRRRPLAGTPGHGPFPVVYDKVVSWTGLQNYCAQRGLTLEVAYTANDHLDFYGRFRPAVDAALHLIARTSASLHADYSNLSVVIRKA